MFQERACEAHRAEQSVRAPLHLFLYVFLTFLGVAVGW